MQILLLGYGEHQPSPFPRELISHFRTLGIFVEAMSSGQQLYIYIPYTYIHIYIYIHTYLLTYLHTYIHTYIQQLSIDYCADYR